LNPVDLETVKVLVDVCPGDMFTGIRDRAIFLCLLDTGARAAELCAMNLADLDQVTGAILIRQGKGRKPRTVYLGKKSRKAIRAYLKHRQGFEQALWVTDDQEDRLTYWGLRGIVKRRAAKAGIQPPELHSFRRAFALAMLRAGVDVYSIQELMGHADLQILKRYLKQTDQDQRQAHERGGPVDNADF
jgi:site-specific recombinase XerD